MYNRYNRFAKKKDVDGTEKPKVKYNNKKVQTPQGEFDSRLEYDTWLYLNHLQQRGIISGLERQKVFELIPTQYEWREKVKQLKTKVKIEHKRYTIEQSVTYLADFVFRDKCGKTWVVDSKGMLTDKYILKRKMMLYLKGVRILEVKRKNMTEILDKFITMQCVEQGEIDLNQ